MTVLPDILPPGGWHFYVTPAIKLEASTKEALLKLIFDWRLRNGIAPGDILAEVDTYFCSKWPHFCKKSSERPATEQAGMKGEARVAIFTAMVARNMPRGGYRLVPTLEAEGKAKICATCPMNKPWSCGCRGQDSTKQILSAARQMKATKHEASLGYCTVTGRELKTDVWLSADSVPFPQDEASRLPPNCWKLSTYEAT